MNELKMAKEALDTALRIATTLQTRVDDALELALIDQDGDRIGEIITVLQGK